VIVEALNQEHDAAMHDAFTHGRSLFRAPL
jgi:hypothetical protein